MSTVELSPVPREHAVQRLFEQRVANSTRPYRSRGFKVKDAWAQSGQSADCELTGWATSSTANNPIPTNSITN